MNNKESLIRSLVSEGYLKTPEIIEAFRAIARADFVPDELRHEAYANFPLPIGEGQTISQPLTVAFMLELLCGSSDPQSGRSLDSCVGKKILDIGSGSGWTTALLAHIVLGRGASKLGNGVSKQGERVIGIERIPEICEFGKRNLAKYFNESRAKIICSDGTAGLPEEAPFDKILAGAAAQLQAGRASPNEVGRAALKSIPQAWREQLKIGGQIVAPVEGSVWLYTKKSETEFEEKEFPGFAFVPLISS